MLLAVAHLVASLMQDSKMRNRDTFVGNFKQFYLLGLVTDGAILWFMYASVGGTVKLITSSCF